MASAKLSALVSLAGAQVPTDLAYVVDVSAGPAGSKKSTLNDLFSIITKNISDGAVRWGGFAAPTPTAAQGSIYYDSATDRLMFSENGAAYKNFGDVTGPASATDNAIARFDLTTGKIIQNSVITIADATGNVLGMGTLNTHTIPAVAADTFALLAAVQAFTNKTITNSNNVLGRVTMTLGSDATGDIYYRDAGGQLTRLGIGSSTQVLTVSGGLPSWQPASGGGTPGGSNTQIQYNNAGAFGGVSGFTSDGTNVTAGSNNLRATSPRFITSINDTNGNELFVLTATGSAINEFTVANAAIGNAPVLSASGGDTNINITISPKGTGFVESTGPLLLSGTGTINFTTPGSAAVPTKISIPVFDPGAFGQILALGIGNINANRRVISLFDARTGAHQPTIGVFSVDETNLIGFSWEGTNTIGYVKNTVGVIGLLDKVIQESGGAQLVTFDTSANAYFGNGITNAAPANYVLNATGGSGSNIAGANLDLAGGKGTGNAIAGFVAVRYPLTGSTGTTLQSLSTSRFPVSTVLYTNTTDSTAVSNTVAETTMLTGLNPPSGATLSIEGGLTYPGTKYRITVRGTFTSTASPNLTIRIKLGGTTLGTVTITSVAAGSNYEISGELYPIGTPGAVTSSRFSGLLTMITATPGAPVIGAMDTIGSINYTTNNSIDITAEWNALSASNSIDIRTIVIERIR